MHSFSALSMYVCMRVDIEGVLLVLALWKIWKHAEDKVWKNGRLVRP